MNSKTVAKTEIKHITLGKNDGKREGAREWCGGRALTRGKQEELWEKRSGDGDEKVGG